jgi:hypothetical protein
MISIAELIGRVYNDLPGVEAFLDVPDVHRAVVDKLNVRTSFARQGSDLNVLLSTSETFVPTDNLYDISALITGTPAWAELQAADGQWYPVRCINVSHIADYALMGDMACAFWSEEAPDGSAPIKYIQFTFVPSQTCRLRYDMDKTLMRLSDYMSLPDNVTDLIVKEAVNQLIPRVKLKLSLNLRRNEEMRQDLPLILETLEEVKTQNREDLVMLVRLWEIWAFRDRGAQGDFVNPTPSGSMLYGEGFGY